MLDYVAPSTLNLQEKIVFCSLQPKKKIQHQHQSSSTYISPAVSVVTGQGKQSFLQLLQKVKATLCHLDWVSLMVKIHPFWWRKKSLKIEWSCDPIVFSKKVANFLIEIEYVGVSKNNGTPKSSILIGFSIINHPFWVFSPYFWFNTHLYIFWVQDASTCWRPDDVTFRPFLHWHVKRLPCLCLAWIWGSLPLP